MKNIFMAVAVTMLAAGVSYAADEVEVRRVLVVDKGTKPSVATQKPRYQYVPTKVNEKANPDLLCHTCMKKVQSSPATSKPSVKGQAVAFVCTDCDHMCWRDEGKEVKFKDEDDTKALKEIESELRKPIDKGTKPSVQRLQELGPQ